MDNGHHRSFILTEKMAVNGKYALRRCLPEAWVSAQNLKCPAVSAAESCTVTPSVNHRFRILETVDFLCPFLRKQRLYGDNIDII